MAFSPAFRALAATAIAALSNCNQQDLAFTKVTFERTPCFGTCPVYKVDVSGDGTVAFEGIRNVDSVGTYSGHIDASAVSKLARAFHDAGYLALEPRYDQTTCAHYATDAARILTSITTPDQAKSIEHDLGCGSDAPAALADLYTKFDDIVGTARWIGNR